MTPAMVPFMGKSNLPFLSMDKPRFLVPQEKVPYLTFLGSFERWDLYLNTRDGDVSARMGDLPQNVAFHSSYSGFNRHLQGALNQAMHRASKL